MRRLARNLFIGTLVTASFCVLAWGQVITSSIMGSVTDSSGASVPGVKITVTNTGTGISMDTTSGPSGTYSVTNLMAGTYSVTAVKDGFQTFKASGIEVQSSAAVRQDVVLQVGQVHQTVEVSAKPALVQTDSPTIKGTVTERQIVALPFQQQSIDGLVALAPGAQTAFGASNPQTGGTTHWGGNNFTLNGISVNDPGNGGAAYSYDLGLGNLPGLSSLQEFQVQSGNMSAEFKNVGTVTLVTKQGTNKFHGSAYEYNENNHLNANEFVLNAKGTPRPFYLRNQFGANIGGPIKKDKAFFFFDYSGLRQHTNPSVQANLPSMAMRTGNFSALCTAPTSLGGGGGTFDSNGICSNGKYQLYNPNTGQPFAGNIIPSSMITSQAQTILGFVPAPTVANSLGIPNEANNYISTVPIHDVMDSYTARIDYQLTPSDRLFGVWNRNVGSPQEVSRGYPSTYGNASDFGYNDNSISVSETHIFSAATLNDFRIAWFDHASIRAGMNLNFDPRSLFPQLAQSPNRGLPTMNMTGYKAITDYGNGVFKPAYDVEISDDFTHVHGSHTIKAGFDETGYKEYQPNPFAPLPSFSFSGNWTAGRGYPALVALNPKPVGNAFADFLLGDANGSSAGPVGLDAVAYDRDWEFYVQDTWQASRKLTITAGLRYMYQTPWTIRDNHQTLFDINTNQLVLQQDSKTATLPPDATPALFAAYSYTTTAALGLPKSFYIPDKNNWAPRIGFAYRPFSGNSTVIRGGYGVFYNFNPYFIGPQQDTLNPPWGGSTLNYSSALPSSPSTTFLPDLTFSNPFPSTNTGGVATPAHPTINMMDRNFLNPVTQQWSLTVEREFANNWVARITYLGSQTHHLQWYQRDINLPAVPSNAPIQDQRPLKPWANIPGTRTGGVQNFNQLQMGLQKHFSNGFLMDAEYEWTRSLDNVNFSINPQNWHFANLDYGNTPDIRRHNLVINYVYELPVGHGRRYLANSNGVTNAVLGGWQLSGITSYGTGLPFTVGFQIPSAYSCCWWGGYANRADAVSGVNPYQGKSSSHDIISGVPWFNTAAYTPPAPYQYGWGARNALFGPGYANWDMSVMKSFTLPGPEGLRLQLRGDFFDAFNHFNLNNPNATIADTRDGGGAIANAGKITSGYGSRVIQVGARLEF